MRISIQSVCNSVFQCALGRSASITTIHTKLVDAQCSSMTAEWQPNCILYSHNLKDQLIDVAAIDEVVAITFNLLFKYCY